MTPDIVGKNFQMDNAFCLIIGTQTELNDEVRSLACCSNLGSFINTLPSLCKLSTFVLIAQALASAY